MATRTLTHLYDSQDEALQTVQALKAAGVPEADISLVANSAGPSPTLAGVPGHTPLETGRGDTDVKGTGAGTGATAGTSRTGATSRTGLSGASGMLLMLLKFRKPRGEPTREFRFPLAEVRLGADDPDV